MTSAVKSMAAMVRTYMMLCVAGLVVTVCILMVMRSGQDGDAGELMVKVVPAQVQDIQSPMRNIKGATDDKVDGFVAALPKWEGKPAVDDEEDAWENENESSNGSTDNGLEGERDDDARDASPDAMTILHKDAAPLMDILEEDTSGERTNIRIADTKPILGGSGGNKNTGDGVSQGGGGATGNLSLIADGNAGTLRDEVDANMENMRIAVVGKKQSRPGIAGGVQDLLRHPESHSVKEAVKPSCEPKNNIMMMKTHKCSSSTMQNILFRWGENHNLTFALPRSGVYLGGPAPFTKQSVMESNGGHYNIIANHLVYNEKALVDLMPADTVFIALLRDPATQYESMYGYYRFDSRFHAPLDQFLKRPNLYYESEAHTVRHAGRNPMLFDIGLDARHLEANDRKVIGHIEGLSKRFDLVLIAEYFKESLILLKDILCWDMDSIVYFSQNARSKSSVKSLTDDMKRSIRHWNGADNMLYQHFNRTLWQKIEAFGYERMKQEVAELERRNTALSKLCIGSTKQAGDSRVWYPPGVNVNSFVLSSNAQGNQLCDQMTRPELTYIHILRKQQVERDSRHLR